jgi:V/A-type H+-transporting ATPase subunit E
MIDSTEKFDRFSRTVLTKARQEYESIITQAEMELGEKTEAYENTCLENAYKSIQKQQTEIKNNATAEVSKIAREARSSIASKRINIVGEVFDLVLDKISAFKQTAQYKEFLLAQISQSVTELGAGEMIIYLDKSDEAYVSDIKLLYPEAEVACTDENIIGGCKVLNQSKMQFADNTVAANLDSQKQNFFMTSGLVL